MVSRVHASVILVLIFVVAFYSLRAEPDAKQARSAPPPATEATRQRELKSAETKLKSDWRTLGADKSNPQLTKLHRKVAGEIRDARDAAEKQLRESWRNLGQNAPGIDLLPRDLIDTQRSVAKPETGSLPFADPDEIRSVDGELRTTLRLVMARNMLYGVPVHLRSYNGKLVGPTLRARPGDVLRITLKNELTPELGLSGSMNTIHAFNITNLHTHGLHVSPAGISDNVLLEVGPQSTQEYEIAIPADHPAGTFWYHAHRHGSTSAQLASGVSGALIVEGGMDDLPVMAKVKQRVFVIQQIAYFLKPPEQPGEVAEGVIEEKYKHDVFRVGTWDALGRFTTINGLRLPVIKIRPGAIERWRMVDSGIREPVYLRLVRTDKSGGAAPATIPMREIAVDGLPLGKITEPELVEMWPGYRSDVLIKAPDQAGVEYLLRDERPNPTGVVISEERRQLARVIVEGPPEPMQLPEDADLAPFRLKSLEATEINQNAIYGIMIDGPTVKFTVNNAPFDHDTARNLELDKTEVWNLRSVNQVAFPAGISHPFHMHVNPFEVFSIKNRDGKEMLTEPIWRDTIVMHEGWRVLMRTQYKDFLGMFVQHCHILDHEDQGMMELVEVTPPKDPLVAADDGKAIRVARPYPAPAWKLPEAGGRWRHLKEFNGRPTVLFFFEGYECPRCVRQVGAFENEAAAFAESGINLVGVSSRALPQPDAKSMPKGSGVTLIADPVQGTFREYGCYAEGPLHGVFVLDSNGLVRWQSIGVKPVMEIQTILEEARKLKFADESSTNPDIPKAAISVTASPGQ